MRRQEGGEGKESTVERVQEWREGRTKRKEDRRVWERRQKRRYVGWRVVGEEAVRERGKNLQMREAGSGRKEERGEGG